MAQGKCPRCGSTNVVRILYGLPGGDMIEAYERGEIELGGCVVGDCDPDAHCKECAYEWRKGDHTFHRMVGSFLEDIVGHHEGYRLMLDRACGRDEKWTITMYTSFDHDDCLDREVKREDHHLCDVDAIIVSTSNAEIKVVIEIEESGITPTKVCGKFLTSALSKGTGIDLLGYRPTLISNDTLFIHVIERKPAMDKEGSKIIPKMQTIERSIKELVRQGNFRFSDYALVIGRQDEFNGPGSGAGERLTQLIHDKIRNLGD